MMIGPVLPEGLHITLQEAYFTAVCELDSFCNGTVWSVD